MFATMRRCSSAASVAAVFVDVKSKPLPNRANVGVIIQKAGCEFGTCFGRLSPSVGYIIITSQKKKIFYFF
jgi:hypothetical protein